MPISNAGKTGQKLEIILGVRNLNICSHKKLHRLEMQLQTNHTKVERLLHTLDFVLIASVLG